MLFALLALAASLAAAGPNAALGQSVEDAEQDAVKAKERAEVASGLVGDAVADRERIEKELAVAIAQAAELSAQLSEVGADIDRISKSMGLAEGEMASIRRDIEFHAVGAYIEAVSTPAVTLVNSGSVGDAMVVRSIARDVVGNNQSAIDALVARLRTLDGLRDVFLAEQAQYSSLQAQLDAQLEGLEALYEEADTAVAEAIRASRQAETEYRAALGAVADAKAREEEEKRQVERTTTTAGPGDTRPRDSDGYLLGPWTHPPAVERWRPLVEQFFPSVRVEQALRIMRCESLGDPDAYNPYSGASGLFQFIPSTWATAAPKAGYPEASPFDPEANTASAAWLANRYEQLELPYWMAWSCKRVLQ